MMTAKASLFLVILGMTMTAQSSIARVLANDGSVELCSSESNRHLSQLELHGEQRFSEFKFDSAGAQVSQIDFAELGADGHCRRRHRKAKTPAPSTPQMGELLTMNVLGKEKMGWRNLIVRCAVNHGKVATFTYQILDANLAGAFRTEAPSGGASLGAPPTSQSREASATQN